jgi:hypothetical protein
MLIGFKHVLNECARTLRLKGRGICFILAVPLIGLPCSLEAQWKSVLTFPPENPQFRCIYFLDLPGPPRIGFAGIWDQLFKTTDGGNTWSNVSTPWFDSVGTGVFLDITFKDSLTGWLTTDGSIGGCFKTTDGGNTWDLLPTVFWAGAVHYDSESDGLFVASWGGTTSQFTSWDEGSTWTVAETGGQTGYAFADAQLGILASAELWNGNEGGWLRTTDGGHTWNTLAMNIESWQPLAIAGTKTFFAISDIDGIIYRTDDAWDTWRQLYTFPFNPNPWGFTTGCIRGDINHLFVQMIDGCYMSTDTGHSWKYLCGVPTMSDWPQVYDSRLYAKDNYVYISTYDSVIGAQIWMLNLDSLNIFPMRFTLADGTKRETVQAGDTVSVYYRPETDTLIGIDSAHFVVRFDSDAMGLRDYTLPPGWKVLSSHESSGTLDLWLIGDTTAPLPNPVLRVAFNTYLSAGDNHPLPPPWKGGGSSAFVYLDSAHLYGHRLNCDCQALSVANPDSVEIDFTGCGDSTLARFMQTGSPFTIESIVPNPARSSLRVEGKGQGVSCEFTDNLGRSILPSTLYALPFTLDVKSIPSGVYYLRLSQDGFVQTRRIIIQK